MNRKDFTTKKALTLATMSFVPLAALGNWPLPAWGADYGQPIAEPPPVYDMVDFASGWYVRGDIAYAAETFPKISSTVSVNPAVSPGFAFGESRSLLNTYSTGAGMGYKVNDWFRTDLVLDYRSEIQSSFIGLPITKPFCITGVSPAPVTGFPVPSAWGTCTPHFATDIHRWDLLANGYIDIGTWQGITPYIGAGAGVSWARIKQSVNWYMGNGLPYQVSTGGFFFDYDRSLGTMTYRFAWAAMAGLSIAVMDHVQLDAGYRFLNLGTISGISAVTGAPLTRTVIANEARVGLRYTID